MRLGEYQIKVKRPADQVWTRVGFRMTRRLAVVLGPELVRFLADAVRMGGKSLLGALQGAAALVRMGDDDRESGPVTDADDRSEAERLADTVEELGSALVEALSHEGCEDLVFDLCSLAVATRGEQEVRLDDRGLSLLDVSPVEAVAVAAFVATEAGFFSSRVAGLGKQPAQPTGAKVDV